MSAKTSNSAALLFQSISNLTSNDYSVLHRECINLSIWMFCLFVVYLLFDNEPYLFTNPSDDMWYNIRSSWPYDIRFLYVILYYIFSALPFFASCFYYDIIHYCKLFEKYRIAKSDAQQQQLISDTVWYDVQLILVYMPILSFFGFNAPPNNEPIPNLYVICVKLLAAIYGFDVFFYLTHRMLHYPMFYKYHKLHHEYKSTISWASVWSSTVELVISNLPSTYFPVVILRPHPVIILLYFMYRNIETTVGHSGYDLPFYLSPIGILKHLPGHYQQERFHAYHHSHNDGCFSFYFMDAIFGTNEKFRKYYFHQKFK